MSARRLPGAKRQQQLAHDWNRKHPPGTPVIVTLDDGSKKQTETVSQAWVISALCEPMAVILLDGVSGGYELARVEARA